MRHSDAHDHSAAYLNGKTDSRGGGGQILHYTNVRACPRTITPCYTLDISPPQTEVTCKIAGVSLYVTVWLQDKIMTRYKGRGRLRGSVVMLTLQFPVVHSAESSEYRKTTSPGHVMSTKELNPKHSGIWTGGLQLYFSKICFKGIYPPASQVS
jgi:hypothetical protein